MTQNIYLAGIVLQETLPDRVMYPTGNAGSNRCMDIYEIRLVNLRELAVQAGGRPALAKRLDMSYPLLQNYIGKTPTKKVGDKTARRAEEVFSLAHGWMDISHEDAEQFSKIDHAHHTQKSMRGTQSDHVSQRWPFVHFTREQFERLPQNRKDRIDAFAFGLIGEWEAAQEEGNRDAG